MSFVIDEKNEELLATKTRRIRDSFTQVIAFAETSSAYATTVNFQNGLIDALQRFQLWSGSVGASIDGQRNISLEWRLREAPELREEIVSLLHDLEEALSDLLVIIAGERENRTKNAETIDLSQNSGPGQTHIQLPAVDEVDDILHVITDCIRSLLRLSILIRKSSPRDRWQRALQSSEKNRLDDQFDIAHVGEKFPKLALSDNEWLRVRFGRAITQRRQFIRYCREHKDRMNDPEAFTDINLDKPAIQSSRTIVSTQASTLQVNQLKALRDDPGDDDVSIITSAVSSLNLANEEESKLSLPSLESLKKGKPEFECPFCCLLQNFTRPKQWKRHAHADLKPYLCTQGKGECETELFTDRNTWFNHELEHHRHYLVCVLCNTEPVPSLSNFEDHLRNSHPDVPNTQHSSITSLCKKPIQTIPASECPFCNEYEAKLREREVARGTIAAEQSITMLVPTPKFRRHVASHMEQLALFALGTSLNGDASLENSSDVSHSETAVRDAEVMQHYVDNQDAFERASVASHASSRATDAGRSTPIHEENKPKWAWDTFETYRLRQADLESLLRREFGHYDFYIQVRNGYYQFWIPAPLDERQREELAFLRFG